MFKPRTLRSLPPALDADGLKLYSISADDAPVDIDEFQARLIRVKASRHLAWASLPAFAIFHRGASAPYLVVAWWGNDNELFTSVSVRIAGSWVEDPERYSFCLWDLEVIWHERNSFIRHLYSDQPDLTRYRADICPTASLP